MTTKCQSESLPWDPEHAKIGPPAGVAPRRIPHDVACHRIGSSVLANRLKIQPPIGASRIGNPNGMRCCKVGIPGGRRMSRSAVPGPSAE